MLSLTACGELKTEEITDSKRFKEEYEIVNGTTSNKGNVIREIEIPEDNPIVFSDYATISNMMDEGKTFAVYFGFATCPWCRASLNIYLDCAKKVGIDTIYYVDVFRSRDIYEYNENDEIECTNEADPSYYDLLEDMGDILDEYIIKKEGYEDYDVGEKRIYAPNYIAVVNGKAVKLEETGNIMEDAYGEITPEITEELTRRYTELFTLLK